MNVGYADTGEPPWEFRGGATSHLLTETFHTGFL